MGLMAPLRLGAVLARPVAASFSLRRALRATAVSLVDSQILPARLFLDVPSRPN